MQGVAEKSFDPVSLMPAKKKPGASPQPDKASPPTVSKQVNFRATGDLLPRLEDTAEGLGLDVSNLVRMILNENLSAYERRVEQIRAARKSE